jgi:hypothetical protein
MYTHIAIRVVGGGIAGAAAAGSLSRLPNVQLKVYERSDAIREVGALIGVMVSGTLGWFCLLLPLGKLYLVGFHFIARRTKAFKVQRCDYVTSP